MPRGLARPSNAGRHCSRCSTCTVGSERCPSLFFADSALSTADTGWMVAQRNDACRERRSLSSSISPVSKTCPDPDYQRRCGNLGAKRPCELEIVGRSRPGAQGVHSPFVTRVMLLRPVFGEMGSVTKPQPIVTPARGRGVRAQVCIHDLAEPRALFGRGAGNLHKLANPA